MLVNTKRAALVTCSRSLVLQKLNLAILGLKILGGTNDVIYDLNHNSLIVRNQMNWLDNNK
jgi:hypothetical protein